MAPGGPIEQKLAQLRFAGAESLEEGSRWIPGSEYGVSSEELVEALKKQYGFDKPDPCSIPDMAEKCDHS